MRKSTLILLIIFLISSALAIKTDVITMPKKGFDVEDVRFDSSKGYEVNEISNDQLMTDGSTTAIVTEYAVKGYYDFQTSDKTVFLPTTTTAAPVYHYKLNDNDGGFNVEDSGITNSDLTANTSDTAWTTTTAKIGRAWDSFDNNPDFVGGGGNLSIGARRSISGTISNSTHTITVWAKPYSSIPAADLGLICYVGNANTGYGVGFFNGDKFKLFDGSTLSGSTATDLTADTYAPGQWHHLVVVTEGVSCYLYVDGVTGSQLEGDITVHPGSNMNTDSRAQLMIFEFTITLCPCQKLRRSITAGWGRRRRRRPARLSQHHP